MKISYNWLKWYIPDCPEPEKLESIFTYHLCEVESVEKWQDDTIFDINILPNRAHDLLSHQGVARALASILDIPFKDPTEMYKIPESKPTNLKIEIQTNKCRRYMGRIVRDVKVGASPEWVVKHLESVGQRSINNIVDATNIVMLDCGQPCHAFDLDKLIDETIIIREAQGGEEMTTLDNKEVKFKTSDMVIADKKSVLAIAGVKGGKLAEVDLNTKNLLLEVANFDPTSVRKTAQSLNIFTDARKRFENDLSAELVSFAMRELTGLLVEYGGTEFEDIIDIYPSKQKEQKLSFSVNKISKILGLTVSGKEVENILKRHNFNYKNNNENFEIVIPPMRLDLQIEEDMAEEIGRILGYEKVKPKIPEINFKSKLNENYVKINWARNKLLNDGYSEVMTYSFCDIGEVEVLASASDKKFLRTNLSDGLKESLKLNQLNAPLLGINYVKIFEIGTVFKKDSEQINVCFGDKKNITEVSLNDFYKDMLFDTKLKPRAYSLAPVFKMWSLFPFIARDIAVWVPETVKSNQVHKVIKENAGDMLIKGPDLFDEFKKPASLAGGDAKISYAFKMVFQSYERTLTDTEINEHLTIITNKIKEKKGWQVR